LKKILLTGLTGFIGRNVAESLLGKKYEIDAIVRPETAEKRVEAFQDSINIIQLDLTNIPALRNFLDSRKYDVILHIGAIRGGRKFSQKQYYKVNVEVVEQLVAHAVEHSEKLIFCSSVGIFGAIPLELPATNLSPRQNDNYYHYTKNRAEDIIQKYVLRGLNAVIIRPSITYGPQDYGFPYMLTKLIDKHLFFLPTKPVAIHLTNIELLKESFKQSVEMDIPSGSEFIIADRKSVLLADLADFIHQELHQKPFPISHFINEKYFNFGKAIAKRIKSEVWVSRFDLISKSWFYFVDDAYQTFGLKTVETIPHFKSVIEWYKHGNSNHK
jgi:nucleoside-diphosphate-sugar epimerase